jgi:two-component system response regulator BaeR
VEEIDRLLGLELGADDYICKPFSPREMVARVKAVLRRMLPVKDGNTLKAGGIVLNEETREVTLDGQDLKLTPIEFNLLRVFMAYPGRVFSRSELVNRVQGYDYEGYDRTVDTHIKNLRRKIAGLLPGQDIICSIYGVGYKLQVS